MAFLFLVALSLQLRIVSMYPKEDFVKGLPDCEYNRFRMFSGYLDVSQNKALHYVFVESAHDATTDPLLIWMNGGPGCSSLIGFIKEHGPCVIEDGQDEVINNPHSWN
jgi:hypothetical protein